MRRSKAIFHRQVFAALAAGEQLSEKAPDDVLSFSQRLLVWFFVIIPKKSVGFPSVFAKQNDRPVIGQVKWGTVTIAFANHYSMFLLWDTIFFPKRFVISSGK